jgi:ribosomal protein S18 acetylase RimI-like enzyme
MLRHNRRKSEDRNEHRFGMEVSSQRFPEWNTPRAQAAKLLAMHQGICPLIQARTSFRSIRNAVPNTNNIGRRAFMPTLVRISPENAAAFRMVRLQALKEDPTSFGSTYAKESELTEAEWLKRAARWSGEKSVGYLAVNQEMPNQRMQDQGMPCGIVASYVDEEDPQRAQVVSMWVSPTHRRSGLGTLLIDAIQKWATAQGVSELQLMVTNINHGAIQFYQRLGFALNGVTSPYPNDASIFEYQMIKSLRTIGNDPAH